MAVEDAGCVGGETLFSWQSQKLVVRVRSWGSHGSPRHWLWGGETEVLMAVSETGCGGGGGAGGVLMAVSYAGCKGVEAWVLMAVPDAGCGGEKQGSHGSPRSWL